MNLFNFLTFFTNLFLDQTIEVTGTIQTGFWGYLWTIVGYWFCIVWQGICGLFYGICKLLLALTDFLQYFIQKLIGLDYWLNSPTYTIEGATKSDLLFSFLYNETVQKTFRAMVGLFLVLLIVFTIFAIVRNEWQYISGGGKGGNFGDGANTKTAILKSSIKAIMLVLTFPLLITLGIISSDAILASLVKALNIDTGSTFGQQLFNIAAQSANRYRQYASVGSRQPITDEITFYISDEKYIYLNTVYNEDEKSIGVSTFEDYVVRTANAKKYTVRTIFDPIQLNNSNFTGYCILLDQAEYTNKGKYFLVQKGDNDPVALYYYLNNVLKAKIMTKTNDIKNPSLQSAIVSNCSSMDGYGFISNCNLNNYDRGSEVYTAAYNTWGYATTYMKHMEFVKTMFYSNMKIASGTESRLMFTGS
ncbi:MAG: hypothetical protein IJZ26_03420, partial [Clostridia bacterium]|nr:hypothetical protein [Clostridia bacterium]